MSADAEFYPPPNDPVEFESLCLDVWKEIWQDPGAQKVGRSGQAQAGVDVVGKVEGRRIGVQCKQKGVGKKVSVRQLEEEVEKAKGFQPALHRFILATSGERDAEVQQRAREITEQHQESGFFEVEVWSWMDIWHEIYGREALFRRILPLYWPRTAALTIVDPHRQLADYRARLKEAAEKIGRCGEDLEAEARGQGDLQKITDRLAELAKGISKIEEQLGAGTSDPVIDAQPRRRKEDLDRDCRAMQTMVADLRRLTGAEWVSVSARQLERQLEPFKALRTALKENRLLVG